ncbi:hypothetical protein NC653_038860 [Populus alba x Populus x berolinensis]|uniref:SMP domain-containing protein n=1 Tax=Populus alba x Populus x berolinensis TaxID=444605 RepID=A0AAD6LHZ8_9ROSI|nr:hypothetical protein NC653_038860 [Populus alba x Populus x berolinensis]
MWPVVVIFAGCFLSELPRSCCITSSGLNRKTQQQQASHSSSSPPHLQDPRSPTGSLDYAHNKKVLKKIGQWKQVQKDQKRKKRSSLRVNPIRKQAKIKDRSLILTDSGAHIELFPLKVGKMTPKSSKFNANMVMLLDSVKNQLSEVMGPVGLMVHESNKGSPVFGKSLPKRHQTSGVENKAPIHLRGRKYFVLPSSSTSFAVAQAYAASSHFLIQDADENDEEFNASADSENFVPNMEGPPVYIGEIYIVTDSKPWESLRLIILWY